MTLHWIDHVYFVLLAFVFPVTDFRMMRRSAKRIHAGEAGQRMRPYRCIVRWEWGCASIFRLTWYVFAYGWAELGLELQSGTLAWIGYGLATASCGALVLQARIVIRSTTNRALVRKQIGWLSFLTPSTGSERRAFDALSVTAGVCEEILFRGFVIAYLTAALAVTFWPAALLSAVLFGAAHAYQGPSGAAKAGLVGVLMALFYWLTGALWAPIVAHAVMDLTSGRIAYAASRDELAPGSSTCPAM